MVILKVSGRAFAGVFLDLTASQRSGIASVTSISWQLEGVKEMMSSETVIVTRAIYLIANGCSESNVMLLVHF